MLICNIFSTLTFCLIYRFSYAQNDNLNKSLEIRDAFLHAWNGYKQNGLYSDEIKPISNRGDNTTFQGWGATLIDSLSSLWLMDLKKEFYEAMQIVKQIDFTKSKGFVLVFETIIRYLGGLISAYDLSREEIFKLKAIQLADSLLPAFNTKYGLPYYRINFNTGQVDNNGDKVILSEAGTIQLEFYRLSQITGNLKYYFVASRIFDHLHKLKKPFVGLYPLYLDINTGEFNTKEISFGSLGDSFYEYLLKTYILTNDTKYLEMFKESIVGLKSLIRRDKNDQLYFGLINKKGNFEQKMDHLSFFVPAMLVLGATVQPNSDYYQLAVKLIEPMVSFYSLSKTKLGPEVIQFYSDKEHDYLNPSNNLRPELIESLFYLCKYSADNERYQDYAYEIYKAFIKYSKTEIAFAGYKNINNNDVESNQIDKMESFFTAETLLYLYLIFKPRDYINLDEWVFNTEAHPIRIAINSQKYL